MPSTARDNGGVRTELTVLGEFAIIWGKQLNYKPTSVKPNAFKTTYQN